MRATKANKGRFLSLALLVWEHDDDTGHVASLGSRGSQIVLDK